MEIINIIAYAILAPCLTFFLYNVIGSPEVRESYSHFEKNGYVNQNMILHFIGAFICKMYLRFEKSKINPFGAFLCPYCLNFWIALFVGIFAAYSNHISYISVVAIIALSQQLVKYAK